MARRLLLRLGLAVLLTLGLTILWNFPTAVSIGKPYLAQVAPALIAAQSQPAGESGFSFPRLGIAAPVTDAPNISPLRTGDWGTIRKALTQGVALSYPGTSLDEASLAFLTGHSSDTYPHAYSSVFAGLGQAKVGDTFTLGLNGKTYRYTVVSRQILDPARPAGFEALAPTASGRHRLVLVTCWPIFTTSQRLVVVGELL